MTICSSLWNLGLETAWNIPLLIRIIQLPLRHSIDSRPISNRLTSHRHANPEKIGRILRKFFKNSATVWQNFNQRSLWNLDECQRKCYLRPLFHFTVFYLWYFSTFLVGTFSEGSRRQKNSSRFPLQSKGQLISEWKFDVLNFPKKQPKNLMNFCPRI